MTEVKPFLKWIGGKRQLLKDIRKYYPFNSKITKYCEPFVGGGAVLFDILNKYELKEIIINDLNKELINTYLVVKTKVHQLIEDLENIEKEYLSLDEIKQKEYFLERRKEFNILKKENYNRSLRLASLFIFLNKTCFNGLYRVNKKGEFNAPHGKYKNPLICDKENLLLVSEKLKNLKITQGDYKKCLDFIDENTFVYLDPPYKPLSKTANFVSYNENIFADKEQKELSEFINLIDKKGAFFLLSNSDPKNVNENDDYFRILYDKFHIETVLANRTVNSDKTNRGKINELLISNIKEV